MKILHIDETFHPSYGYHTAILARYQAKKNDVCIITVDKDHLYPVYAEFDDSKYDVQQDKIYEMQTGVSVTRIKTYGYISGRAIYSSQIFKEIKRINPDIIYCHLLESLIAIKLILRKNKYPIFFDSHMLSMASKNKFSKVFNHFYRSIITKRIIKRNYQIIKTQDDPYVNSILGIPDSLTRFVSFGTDTDLFCPNQDNRKNFRKDNGISDEDFVVIYTGKICSDKGSMLLAKAFSNKFETKKRIVLIIVGNFIGEYGEEVRKVLGKCENKIIVFPLQKYCDLPSFYQSADLCVFPKQCSLSFYDAQACGVPVLSEDNNVNVDRVKYGNGFNFISDDYLDFHSKVEMCANLDDKIYDKMREQSRLFVSMNYGYHKIVEEYETIMDGVIKHYGKSNADK